ALAEEQEWFIKLSYQARWASYAIVTCQHFIWYLSHCYSLMGKRDCSTVCSWTESFVAYDADLEEFVGNESEASYGTRSLCAISFIAQRDCFFLPCGPLRLLYHCGTKIAEAAGSCPICRKKLRKVKLIYTV
ncbi:unnamed protein product, partial [Brassica oleracea var. botrytis]